MLQLRPTFSESWYRVVNLKPRLRATAQISRQFYRGDRWYVVRDPAGNQFHRLSDAAYRFVGLLDGHRTVGDAWELVGGQLADDAPTQPEVIQILSQLYSANLIETDVTPDAQILLRRHKKQMQRKLQGRLMNVLFPRIPLWDPDRFLVRWMPLVKPFISKFGAILWLAVVVAAGAVLAPRWNDLQNAANNAIAPSNWIWLWGTFVLIKFIHELGHAFSCRRFGGECHEMGIMFLVFIPTPYVDASSAWAFPNKWARMLVGAGGMVIELFLASLCAFVWAFTSPGVPVWGMPVNELAYNAMLIASVTTVLFNANPLLRYDGYYMLSDWLEIPNLQMRSREYLFGLIKRHVFRIKSTQPLPPVGQRMWLFSYGLASGAYRIFIGLMIIVIVAYQVPILGALMALGGIVTWAVVPVVKLFKYLTIEPELHRKRGRAWAFCLTVGATAVFLIGILPWPLRVYAEGITEPLQKQVLNVRSPGFVHEIKVKTGDWVKAGQPIVVLTDEALAAEIEQLRAQLAGLKIKRQQSMVYDQGQRQIDDEEIAAVERQLGLKLKQQEELTVRAEIDGQVIAPKLHELQGAYMQRGAEVATVALMDELQIYAVVTQQDAELVEAAEDPTTEVRLAGDPTTPLFAREVKKVGVQRELPHAALGMGGGGEIAVDPRDPDQKRLQQSQYELRIMLANPDKAYLPGQRAYVRVELEKRPLLWQWIRKFLQLIQVHRQMGSDLAQ